MKLMIASDLHGSAAYTRRLLELYRDTGCQRLVLLGDLLYHGPRNPLPEGYEPPAVAKMLNDMADELLCVRGNCDAEVDQMVLHFPILSDSALLVLDGLTIHATHGHIHGPDTPPPLRQGDILLCGHFHVPVRRDCGCYTYLNPGSVALPKENSPHSKDECEEKARSYISLAIAKCAADQVSETAVSVVALPNDEMKGRIIGREGRNIRTLETLTGVDIIIDDTPEAIALSCFDHVRREVARIALEKLIADGRIHPTKIEEMVEKARREVEHRIRQEGERAVLETNVHGLNNELVKLLGRLYYRTSYRQNVLMHSIEVSKLCGVLASELGVDANLARRAGLLHDIGKALTAEIEGSHVQIGVDVCRKYNENNEVIHAIEAHHNDVEPKTAIACIVQAADAISAARPAARSENYENYIKRLQKLESICASYEGVEKCYALQAGREIRVMVVPEVINDEKMVLVARQIAKQIETEMDYPGQIKVNLIRESRVVDYAK